MVFILSEPFSSKFGKEIRINVEGPTPLRMLIMRLPIEIFSFVPDRTRLTDHQLLAHILFFRNGCLIRIDDWVENIDIIKLMLPVADG
jgi:hypothetical protein